MDKISLSSLEEYNQPLDETYLLGYYLQKNTLYTKKESEMSKEED